MSRKYIQITFSILLLSGMIFGFAIKDGTSANANQAQAAQGNPTARLESQLLDQLNAGPADFIVMMTEQADVGAADQMLTKEEKGQYVFDTLVATTARTQTDLRAYLDSQSVDYQSFYIVNAIWVKSGTLILAQTLADRNDVASIRANHTYQLEKPINSKPSTAQPLFVEPNISFVKADQVWAMGFTGQGIVVADDNTGLISTHPAIARHYRGCLNPPDCTQLDHNYNWYDAFDPQNVVPWDDYGNGTSTAGIMVGDDGQGNQIGMAPGAQLISCKNMVGGSSDDAHVITCFQWNLAPWDLSGTNPRPDLAPDAVNNSWGFPGGGNEAMRTAVANLLNAGIVVEVSAGDDGSSCQSLSSPGDYQEVFTTGSVNHTNPWPGTVTGSSSRGPSVVDGNYFPDFMAPGESIRSAAPGDLYGYSSGTSMAGPHVTGLIGLIWSANPALRGQIDTTYSIIQQTSAPITGYAGTCGGDYVTGPNNDWGYGTIDAYQAALLAISYGGTGVLQGTVVDDTSGLPIAGAAVHAVRQEGSTWNDTTDASGFYQITVAPGTFDVTANHPHFMAQTVNNVVVAVDGTTTQDFNLNPRGWSFGYVYDFDNGTPITNATVSAEEGSSSTTNGTGYYELYLDPGEHTLTANAQDYSPDSAVVTIVSGFGVQQDFFLQASVVFIPSPIVISIPWGSSFTQPAMILNRLPTDYAFEFLERDMGFLPLGGEKVKVDVEASPASAPANTAVAVNGYKSRPSGAVSIQRYARITQSNILLLNADDDNLGYSPIRDMLLAYGDLGAVDLLEARYLPPTLDQLMQYDVVVVWSNYVFSNPNGIGNVLADYVDAGGKVIDLNFALDPSFGYQGRFRSEGYSAMTIYYIGYVDSCLGDFDPSHPIMNGISDVCDVYRGKGSALTAGSSAVARWQDGELFVAVKDDRSVATINGYVGIYYSWTGQMADVLHNAINWIVIPADVPWLSEDPIAGSVPIDGSLPVNIMFDASPEAGVTEPGAYSAELTLNGDPKLRVPVSMLVEAPSDWGHLEGTIIGLGYCDQNPATLEGAMVEIVGGPTLTTDANGYYATWLPAGIYTVNVTAEGHLAATASVEVIAQENTTQNFDLRWDQPCITEDPSTLSVTLDMGASITKQISLSNGGASLGTFEISDLQNSHTTPRQGFLPPAVRPSTPGTTPSFLGRAPNAPTLSPAELSQAVAQMVGEPAYAMEVYPSTNLVTFFDDNPGTWTIIASEPGRLFYAGDFINGDFSTLYVLDSDTNSLNAIDTTTGTVTYIGDSIPGLWESWTGMAGADDGTMYAAASSCGGNSTLYTVDLSTGDLTTIGDITNATCIIDIAITPDGTMYGVDLYNDTLLQIDTSTGAGTIIGFIGFDANFAQGMDYEEESGTLYMAAYGNEGELRIVDPANGATQVVGAFPSGAEVDSLAFASGGGGDAPWLSQNPISGTIAPDGGQQVVDVTFNAGLVTQPGTHTGLVQVKTNDPVFKNYIVEVTMFVNPPANWGQLSGTVSGLGYCDANPAPLQGAQVAIEGGLTGATDANGSYLIWLAEGTYNVTVTKDGHTVGTASVEILPGGQVTTHDFTLRSTTACTSANPLSFDVSVAEGYTLTVPLTLINSGAGSAEFKVREADAGMLGKHTAPAGVSSVTSPQGYLPKLTVSRSQGAWPLGGTVAIFKDYDPWGVVATEQFLAMNGIPYEVHTSDEFGTLDFTQYGMIVFSGDQPTSFYDAYAGYVWKFEDYVRQGGFLNFFSCDNGWNTGVLTAPLPGGMQWTGRVLQYYNVVDDPAHPVVQGVPDPFYGYFASHGHFSNLPIDAHVIAREQMGLQPTIVEYPIGAGWLIAFGQPLEISYNYGYDAGLIFANTLLWGYTHEPQGDILWLSGHPITGTIAADSNFDIDVTFDTLTYPLGTTVEANLVVYTDDNRFIIPVVMHVVAPESLKFFLPLINKN